MVLRKLKQLQDLGHEIIIIIGDFTGKIGDPTGKSRMRKFLSDEEVLQNAKTYEEQVFKILDKEKTTIKFNSEWLSKLTFGDVLKLTASTTVARMLEREDFKLRFENQRPIYLNEFFYPLMQAFDSTAIEADIEFGGTDQRFNLLSGRNLQKEIGEEPQIVIKENGMEQTILQFVMDEIKQNKRMIEDLTKKQIEDEIQQGNYNFNVQQIVHDILQKLNNQEVSLKDTSSSHLSYMQIEYYTLIAMACMYGGMLGLTAINNQLANMSAKGKRVSVSPNKKGILVLSSALGSYLVSLVGLAILLIFLKFGLNVEFGSQWLYIIILSLVGDLAGISMGIFIASVFRVSEQAKTGINIAISMFFSVLSGMMGVTLKYVIDKNIPIVNLINPNNLITDGFYALYYYNTFNRYIRDICCLGVFIIVCLFISFRTLRREQYDYI